MLKKLFKNINQNWLYSIIIMVVGFIFSFFILQIKSELAYNLSLITFALSIFISLIFGVIRLFKKDYLKGALQIVTTFIIGGTASVFLFSLLMFYPNDFFADHLEIPKNIKFDKPINQNDYLNSEQIEIIPDKETLILYDVYQPGMYQYEIFLHKIEKGNVYLKFYEITTNQILSEENIKRDSKIQVFNATDELKKFKLNDPFTIKEGNWDQFYGSKIEVWFQPENLDLKERKLFSKNYIVQGWER